MQMMTESRIAEFWRRVDRSTGFSSCWIWKSSQYRNGYGYFSVNGRKRLAHRIAFELGNGRKLEKSEICRHQCNVPLCCNPSHLLSGTQYDNIHDCLDSGRFSFAPRNIAEMNGRAKLDFCDVKKIRALCASGESQKAVAFRFGVSPSSVSDIVHGKHWKAA
jgi:hypothetical protein